MLAWTHSARGRLISLIGDAFDAELLAILAARGVLVVRPFEGIVDWRVLCRGPEMAGRASRYWRLVGHQWTAAQLETRHLLRVDRSSGQELRSLGDWFSRCSHGWHLLGKGCANRSEVSLVLDFRNDFVKGAC